MVVIFQRKKRLNSTKSRKKRTYSTLNRSFLKVYREESLKEHDGKCTFCYEPLTYKNVTADHRKAQVKGGTHRKDNITAACFECNQTKGSMSESAYRKAIKSPSGRNIYFLMAWSRRKINLQTDRSINNIKTYFGME